MHTSPTGNFLWQALAVFLLIGALLGILLGMLLIFRPRLLERVNHVANRWITMRHANRWLDRSVSIEQWLYQRHRPLGMVIVFGACYILAYFGLLFDKAAALRNLATHVPAKLLEGLLDALVLVSLTGAVVALFVGLAFWLRPSLLRGVEKETNRWVSSRQATKVMDMPHSQVDSFVTHHARQAGWLLLLGSIYLFFAVLRILM